MAPTAATEFPATVPVPVPSDRPDFLVNKGGDEAPMKSLPSNFIRDQDERPTVAYNDFSKDIPVISLNGIDGTEESRSRVREAVTSACEEWGIFQIIDHGVPKDLVADMHRLSKEFFALPVDEKLLYDMRKEGSRGGFVVSSHLKGEATLDYREIFTYFSYPQRLRDYSRWPGKPEGWKSTVELYSEALMGLACKLLGLLAEALCLETEALTEACVEMDQKVVINYYPTCPEPDKCLGLKRHTDPGTITLLLQDLVGGLQATKDNGQTWITVEPIEGAFVVNLGDHMQFLSNGKFKSADHQAVVNSERSRLSIATFQNPAQNATVYPLPGVMKEGEQCILEEPITFTEMYKRKMSRDIEEARKKKLAKQNLLDSNITDAAPSH